MDTQAEHGEPERREGLGGRVRRFIDNEVNRALDKKDRGTDEVDTDYRDTPDRGPGIDAHGIDADQEPVKPVTMHPEPVTSYDDLPAQPVAPVPPAAGDRVEEARSGQVSDRSSEEVAADSSAERVGLLDDPAGLRDQWQLVQGAFVDDPQHAVHEASVLVDRTLQEIRRNISRGQTTNPPSTEDLRVSFQRYREFFQRLLSA